MWLDWDYDTFLRRCFSWLRSWWWLFKILVGFWSRRFFHFCKTFKITIWGSRGLFDLGRTFKDHDHTFYFFHSTYKDQDNHSHFIIKDQGLARAFSFFRLPAFYARGDIFRKSQNQDQDKAIRDNTPTTPTTPLNSITSL